MENSLFVYMERLEVMGFFLAYPLGYLLIQTIAVNTKKTTLKKLPSLLPYSYALVGVLYFGLQLKNLYPDYSISHIKMMTEEPILKIWGLLSLIFWLPALAKNTRFSLIHSLVFLFFLLKDLVFYSFNLADKSVVQNDMSIYSNSLLINIFSFLIILLFNSLINLKKR